MASKKTKGVTTMSNWWEITGKLANDLIDSVKDYLVKKIDEDGKTGKDLTLEYILSILDEAKNKYE